MPEFQPIDRPAIVGTQRRGVIDIGERTTGLSRDQAVPGRHRIFRRPCESAGSFYTSSPCRRAPRGTGRRKYGRPREYKARELAEGVD